MIPPNRLAAPRAGGRKGDGRRMQGAGRRLNRAQQGVSRIAPRALHACRSKGRRYNAPPLIAPLTTPTAVTMSWPSRRQPSLPTKIIDKHNSTLNKEVNIKKCATRIFFGQFKVRGFFERAGVDRGGRTWVKAKPPDLIQGATPAALGLPPAFAGVDPIYAGQGWRSLELGGTEILKPWARARS
jgi:hypothetical protein